MRRGVSISKHDQSILGFVVAHPHDFTGTARAVMSAAGRARGLGMATPVIGSGSWAGNVTRKLHGEYVQILWYYASANACSTDPGVWPAAPDCQQMMEPHMSAHVLICSSSKAPWTRA